MKETTCGSRGGICGDQPPPHGFRANLRFFRMEALFLGIDIGSTTFKAVLMNERGKIRQALYRRTKPVDSGRVRCTGVCAKCGACNFGQLRQTVDKDIKLDAHFQAKEDGSYPTKENKLGSTINATLNFQFNRNVSWYSRFYYNTSYHRIEGEWENRFTFAWSRFFSTNITLNLRYDDGVAKNEDFDSYLQINELLSFGFNYKW